MGRQSDLKASSAKSATPPPYRDDPPQSSSASAHSLQPYEYAEVEPSSDLPAYTDDPSSSATEQGTFVSPTSYDIPGGRDYNTRAGSSIITFDPSLSADAQSLHALVLKQSHLPPKPVVRIQGTHSETTRDGNGKKSKNNVIDFDFKIEPRETLLRSFHTPQPASTTTPTPGGEEEQLRNFRKLIVVEDGDKAFRGSRLKVRAPGWKAPSAAATDVENAGVGSNPAAPHLGEWCHRFCDDPAGTKSFTFHRYITDWKTDIVTSAFKSHIRATNYRGHTSVQYPIDHAGFTVYSPSLFNKLRTNNFVWWTCVILQLWIITWPLVWFLTRRYEVVSCQWPYVRDIVGVDGITRKTYAANRDEEDWSEMWKKAVQKAALARMKGGEWITERDIWNAEDARREEVYSSQRRASEREQTRKGSGFMNGVVGIAQGVADASAEYNRQAGWGGDQD